MPFLTIRGAGIIKLFESLKILLVYTNKKECKFSISSRFSSWKSRSHLACSWLLFLSAFAAPYLVQAAPYALGAGTVSGIGRCLHQRQANEAFSIRSWSVQLQLDPSSRRNLDILEFTCASILTMLRLLNYPSAIAPATINKDYCSAASYSALFLCRKSCRSLSVSI